jgi:hypothetical protein
MELARDAAPEIDRLAWTVDRGVGPKHGPGLSEMASAIGLDSLLPFPVTADFLLAGTASVDLICQRMPYSRPVDVHTRFEGLMAMDLVEARDGGVVATGQLVPLLETLRQSRADVAADTWTGHEQQMATVTDLARKVAMAASDDHAVAVVHRELPAADDPYLLLFDRLVTLRYVRQYDHVAAWQDHGLTAPMIVILTRLRHGESVTDDADGLSELVARGLAHTGPVALSDKGRTLRDDIEAETNRRAQVTFDALGAGEGAALLDGLRQLPGSGG